MELAGRAERAGYSSGPANRGGHGNFFPALGAHALGFAPFGMDYTGYSNYPLGTQAEGEERIAPFATLYEVMAPMARDWARIAYEHRTWGVAKPDDNADQTLDLGRWHVNVEYDQFPFGLAQWFPQNGEPANLRKPSGGALIAELGPDEYLVIGQNTRVSFSLANEASANGWLFDRVEEGHYTKGQWVAERVWNGDQTDWGLNFTEEPVALRVKLATY